MVKKLYRSRKDRQIAGVCGGMGEYLDIDSTVIRLAYIALTVLTGIFPGVLLYVITVAVIPEAPEKNLPKSKP